MILTTFGWGNGRVHLLRERAGEEEERENEYENENK